MIPGEGQNHQVQSSTRVKAIDGDEGWERVMSGSMGSVHARIPSHGRVETCRRMKNTTLMDGLEMGLHR